MSHLLSNPEKALSQNNGRKLKMIITCLFLHWYWFYKSKTLAGFLHILIAHPMHRCVGKLHRATLILLSVFNVQFQKLYSLARGQKYFTSFNSKKTHVFLFVNIIFHGGIFVYLNQSLKTKPTSIYVVAHSNTECLFIIYDTWIKFASKE